MRRKEETVKKICSDIQNLQPSSTLETIYFGGGTPSILSSSDLSYIFDAIDKTFHNKQVLETTFEANPDDLTEEYLTMLLEHGINRISIGIQSFFDRHLREMNRRHDGKQAIMAVKNAKSAGFKNITCDLIYGLPFMTEDEWKENLDIIIGLEIQHISAYHLTIEDGTIFAKKGIKPVPENTSETHYRILCERLGKAGFIHYEISNFAKPGFEAIHNTGYWTGKPYIGIGPSAHSFDGISHRYWQPSDIDKWLAGEKPEEEILTTEERNEEIIMTSLRTSVGLETSDHKLLAKADRFIKQGLMSYDSGKLKITPKYFLLSDYIIGELI